MTKFKNCDDERKKLAKRSTEIDNITTTLKYIDGTKTKLREKKSKNRQYEREIQKGWTKNAPFNE